MLPLTMTFQCPQAHAHEIITTKTKLKVTTSIKSHEYRKGQILIPDFAHFHIDFNSLLYSQEKAYKRKEINIPEILQEIDEVQ